jgi:cell envelope opacity-associated protein A
MSLANCWQPTEVPNKRAAIKVKPLSGAQYYKINTQQTKNTYNQTGHKGQLVITILLD